MNILELITMRLHLLTGVETMKTLKKVRRQRAKGLRLIASKASAHKPSQVLAHQYYGSGKQLESTDLIMGRSRRNHIRKIDDDSLERIDFLACLFCNELKPQRNHSKKAEDLKRYS